MKKFGLIGHPIVHSLSPALFKAAYRGKFIYDLILKDNFEDAYDIFLKEYDGINVTAPFKEQAFMKADIRTPECEAIGATNLLIKTPEGIKAYNSDYLGVRKWLKEREKHATKVLVVGFGGAGKAVAAAAGSLNMDVVIMNRTKSNDSIRPLTDFCKEFRKADIVIYNIPAPIAELEMLTEEDFRGGSEPRPKWILEANYRNPSFTGDILERMNRANPLARYTEGETWLLYQAVTGYEIFTSEEPDIDSMREVLK